MEIFQTIWTALSTPNEELIQIFSIPLIFIEVTVAMLLFTTILNISSAKKQKMIYWGPLGTVGDVSFWTFCPFWDTSLYRSFY